MMTPSLKSNFISDAIAVKTANRTWTHQNHTARKLLDGAIVAAKRTVSASGTPPTLTRNRWVWRLAGSYHLCYPTQTLMKEAAQSFSLARRWSLAQWAVQKAQEERGHDKLALLDLQSMGYQADAVVKALVPPAAKALIDYFTQCVRDSDPIGCVGYSYAMERLATGIGDEYIKRVESILPPGVHATRCLRVHSNVGADREHVKETLAMVAGLSSAEQVRIAKSCYQTALLCFSAPQEGYISEEELQERLARLGLSVPTSKV